MAMARRKMLTEQKPQEAKPPDATGSPNGTKPKLATSKKLLFSALTCLGFFAILELVLWVAGVPTLTELEDPFRGFSGLVKVFQREGPIYRTQPAVRGGTFNDQSFLVTKPSNGLRLFCLGGSSSFGFPWGAEAAFTSIVGEALVATHPERRVETVNASGVSYAMHRLNLVADELLGYKPDVFLVYEGHNEFIEPAFFDALKHRGALRTDFEYALSYSRVYSGMRFATKRLRKSLQPPASGFESRVMRDQTRVYSPAEKEAIVAEFRWRLERLVRRAQAAGVKVVLATVPCNLRQWRPEASTGVAALAEHERQQRSNLFTVGSGLVKSGRFEQAAVELEQAAQLAPHHAETQFLLGQAYEGLERFEDARCAYQRACDEDASPIRRLSGINEAIREIAHQQGALLVDIDRLFEQQSEHGLVGFNLIEDYVHPTRQGHELIAWQIWEAMEQAGWFNDKSHAQKAVFDSILARRRPQIPAQNAVWFYNQGVVLEKQGQVDAAVKSYRQAVELSPNYSNALLNLGKALAETGHFTEAAARYQEALRIRPDLVDAHTGLGAALTRLGRLDEAVAHYQEALRVRPNSAEAHNNLGVALAGRGQLDEAMVHYQKALEINPDHAEAHNNLGVALDGCGRVDEAMLHYQKALQIKPDHADAHNNLGLVLSGRGRVDEAMTHYQRALELKPNYAEAHLNRGMALAGRGQVAEAIAAYREALAIKPDFANAHFNLGVVLAGSGQVAEAIGHYRKALEFKPSYAEAHLNLGAAFDGRGQLDEAIASYQQAVKIKPDFAEAHFNLATALAARGQLNEAVAHFQKALSAASARNNSALADVIRARLRRLQSLVPADKAQ
jgi:tetratricopeptide (TPR) repeat protein